MSKPVREVEVTTTEECKGRVRALVDSGSYHTFIREDKVPAGALVVKMKSPKLFGQAELDTKLVAIGTIYLQIHIENHDIDAHAFVSPKLTVDMIIGAGDMQRWDISVVNDNGHTSLRIGHDLNDPDVQTVL
ncbi:MAG: hypothetical protein A3G34_01995 [Candidatus Lindowbacteria bacterium RIFCSPLOWO2_12_FULL_62_27]|nr:MAG: hypothetical protein A3I06_11515 [Candidatus Lindowbacteria bacterium RIFCSPLOWO2_02_FULL_62_12]OGH59079.1 MAG: hypothetical protein A3G34_01995 [Candidatus Lindowbacteria bacterium RIFCSPLOWO2_12_FULL_62_27]